MTRVDFHTNIPDKLQYACRLARKAYAARAKVVLLAENAAQAAALNEALWTLSDTDFLPHVLASDPLAAETPIVITDNEDVPLPHHDMLVNLTQRTPSTFAQFARVFEIISSDEQDAAAGRQRYVAYKKGAYPLTHFVAGQS
ncbi:DNA polymerase III subunit chi [Massilia sp. Dwa41.01b]|uniref:DNA polymerase III subunit chi n=1 Tax=unclassified Massilia TaxID=2609279 RepID=UPI001600E4DD|nr:MULTISPECIES: DNA polymerase III subunit chi [unclassified Massilia]QNA90199.1 DNA polymerase III subunit chi [Massilia sp. Dwa41.01b]QNB01087.1 DNA polymerase III subunit chi [Massilia sp. Se16.2.3]